jgi:hypothetical protein
MFGPGAIGRQSSGELSITCKPDVCGRFAAHTA